MPLSAIPLIIHEIFSAPTQDSRIILKGNEVKVERREKDSKKFRVITQY
jgi:hypothetical protein